MIVDLDKLHFEFTDARPEHAKGVRDLLKAIKKCKVDAIPVEWIKNYLKTSPKMWQGYHDEDLVQEMIEDWEAENEID